MAADRPQRTRIGVIGLGLIAQVAHLPALTRLHARAEVTHLADVAPGLARQIAGMTPGDPVALEDWTAMLGPGQPDAVVICTPGDHARIARRCLEAGISVLAEKPLALTVQEATELAELARRSGLVLDVAYMKTHDRVVRRAATIVAELAQPRLVRVTVMHPDDAPQIAHHELLRGGAIEAGPAQDEIAAAQRYSDDAARRAVGDDARLVPLYRDQLSGSVVHELSLLRAVLGQTPEWTSATLSATVDAPPCIHAQGRIGDGVQLALDWLWLPTFPDYEEQLSVYAADGRLTLSLEPPYTRRRTTCEIIRQVDEAFRSDCVLVDGYESSFDVQMADFLDALQTGTPTNSGDDAARDIASLQQLAAVIAQSEGWSVKTEVAT